MLETPKAGISQDQNITNQKIGDVSPDEVPLSKSQLKKLEKLRKKAEFKAAKAKKLEEERLAQIVPIREIKNEETEYFGDLPLICSKTHKTKNFTEIINLNHELEDQYVLIRARVHQSRAHGNLFFLTLRKGFYSVQALANKTETITKDALKYMSAVPNESIVDIYGKVVKPPEHTKCTQKDVEIDIKKFFVVSRYF